ncbi:MAG: hypothetical protein LBQ18_08065 [Campylobacteraceae bacterium]|jgi:hypothetical protein|nr:hypothetical protein [Campylobacteraceae bacterium]
MLNFSIDALSANRSKQITALISSVIGRKISSNFAKSAAAIFVTLALAGCGGGVGYGDRQYTLSVRTVSFYDANLDLLEAKGVKPEVSIDIDDKKSELVLSKW